MSVEVTLRLQDYRRHLAIMITEWRGMFTERLLGAQEEYNAKTTTSAMSHGHVRQADMSSPGPGYRTPFKNLSLS